MSGDPHAGGGKLVGVGMHLSRRCARHAETLALRGNAAQRAGSAHALMDASSGALMLRARCALATHCS